MNVVNKYEKIVLIAFALLGVLFASVLYFSMSKISKAAYIETTECVDSYNYGSRWSDWNIGTGELQSQNISGYSLNTAVYLTGFTEEDTTCSSGETVTFFNITMADDDEFQLQFIDDTHVKFENLTTSESSDIVEIDSYYQYVVQIYLPATPVADNMGSQSFKFNSGDAQTPLKFQAPPFNEDFQSPDFKDWWVCVELPTDHTYTGYSVEIAYGALEDAFTSLDSTTSQVGVIPVTLGQSTSECPLIGKLASDLEPGEYKAQAYLLNQSGEYTFETPILHFKILTGEKVLTPPNGAGTDGKATALSKCIQNGGITGELYEIGCKLAINLIYPADTSLQKFYSMQTNFETHAPFSYFTEVFNLFSEPETGSTTLPTLELDTGTATGINVTWDGFSADTINMFTTPTSRTLFRLIIEGSLYLAFMAFLLYESRKLFNKAQ